MPNFFRHLWRFALYLFALIGLVLVGGFVALRFGWTNMSGSVDLNDRYFSEATKAFRQFRQLDPTSAKEAIINYNHQKTDRLSYYWLSTPEWPVLKEAIGKDQTLINQAAGQLDIKPRLIVAMLVGEQLRLYNSEREIFKQIFQPLKILGTQSKFSWGVLGLKEETAKEIEANLKDANSPFYLGSTYEHLLDFSTTDPDAERFSRLVDEHNHYYSYLYTAIYLKQLMTQWQEADYNIDDRPEILATLFNLGFEKSVPKNNPAVGGAEIDIGDLKYSFGGLAFQFYYSNELANIFPW